MKLCKDCRWYEKPGSLALCMRDAHYVTSPVTGEQVMKGDKCCIVQRDMSLPSYCGPEGQFFQPAGIPAEALAKDEP